VKYLGLNEIRELYLSFFESKQHLRAKSASLIPQNDKSLLLINSGMAPLKAYFTGQEVPPSKRLTTVQKCIRTGDIDQVGHTARHGTFFEMLGNFSFGDYFKEEIIPWAWEFCTQVLELPQDRLYASVYLDDDEAYNIWFDKIKLPKEHIVRLGKEDNFWEVGIGPCGPCSEIYYDKGVEYGCGEDTCAVGCDCDRFMEFWNLVFTQFYKEEDGTYSNLEFPNIDTGMGLERVATIMQNVNSIFEIDTMKSIVDEICKMSGKKYNENPTTNISIRIITDHIRSITFMIGDGILPSNEGRGYVLRRLLRRAVRHGKVLGIDESFLTKLCEVVIKTSGDAYSELKEKKEMILTVIGIEEEKFKLTLDKGLDMIKQLIKVSKQEHRMEILGSDAFKLYDTYGFPVELLKEVLEEEHISLNETEFFQKMREQKELAQKSRESSTFMGADENAFDKLDSHSATEFLGYDTLTLEGANVLGISRDNVLEDVATIGEKVHMVLDKTVFYAESGGQKGDGGKIQSETGVMEVRDVVKISGGKFAHYGKIIEGYIEEHQNVNLSVDRNRRLNTSRNHTATHLLHKALRDVLGNHVEQGGSFVSHDRLRFDFTHFEGMSSEQIRETEKIVNEKILDSIPVSIAEMNIEDAKQKGAISLFGEKYGETVRVVDIDGFSTELCGGTHVNNTSVISVFKIVYEGSVGSGLRRIEAITGKEAFNFFDKITSRMDKMSTLLKTNPDNLLDKVGTFLTDAKNLQKKIQELNSKSLGSVVDDIIKNKISVGESNLVVTELDSLSIDELKGMGDKIKDKLGNAIIVLLSYKDEKVNFVIMVSEEAAKKGIHAGNLMKEFAPIIDGRGGGRDTVAQGGGTNRNNIGLLIEKIKEKIIDTVK